MKANCGRWLLITALFCGLAEQAFSGYPAVPPWQPDSAQRQELRRSLTLMASSMPADRKTVQAIRVYRPAAYASPTAP